MCNFLFLTAKSRYNNSHKQIENEYGLQKDNYNEVNKACRGRHWTWHLKYLGFLLRASRNGKPIFCCHYLKSRNDRIPKIVKILV